MTAVADGVDALFRYFQTIGNLMETLPVAWIATASLLAGGSAILWIQHNEFLRRLLPVTTTSTVVLSTAVIMDAARAAIAITTGKRSPTHISIPNLRERRLSRIMRTGRWALPLQQVLNERRDDPVDKRIVAIDRNRSTLVVGKPGAGKTNVIQLLLEQIKRGNDEALVVFDYKREYQHFYDQHDIDYIKLTPSGATDLWNIFLETDGDTLEEYLEVAKGVFSNQNDGKYWSAAATQVFAGILCLLDREFSTAGATPTNADLVKYLRTHEAEEIHHDLDRHDDLASAAQHIPDEAAEAQAAGVISNVQVALLEMFVGDFAKQGEFAVREYMQNPNGRVLILDLPPERKETSAPVFKFILDWSIRYALQDSRQCSFILDEFARLPRLTQLDTLVTQGRSYNAQAIAGIQSIAQLHESYGTDGADALLSGYNQVILMQPQSGDTPTVDFALETVGPETIDRRVTTVDKTGSVAGSAHEQSEIYPISRDELTAFNQGECVIVSRDGSWVRGFVPLYSDVRDVVARASRSVDEY